MDGWSIEGIEAQPAKRLQLDHRMGSENVQNETMNEWMNRKTEKERREEDEKKHTQTENDN